MEPTEKAGDFTPIATQIPSWGTLDTRWLVELGPTPAERYSLSAPDEEMAIALAQAEHKRRLEGKENLS